MNRKWTIEKQPLWENSGFLRLADLSRRLLIILVWLVHIPAVQAAEAPSYRFGVFPHLPPLRLEMTYAPMAAALGQELGRPVIIGTGSGFDQFRARMHKEEFDFALIPPLDIVPIVDEGNYIALARQPSHPASIVLLETSPIQSVADLTGKTVGLPGGTPASIFVQLTLQDAGLANKQNIYYKEFSNVLACLHQLLVKTVDACASGSGAALHIFQNKMAVKLRVVMRTQAFPHMIFVAHRRLPEHQRERLKSSVLNLKKSEHSQAPSNTKGFVAQYIAYRSEDYDIIRQYRQRWEKHAQAAP